MEDKPTDGLNIFGMPFYQHFNFQQTSILVFE